MDELMRNPTQQPAAPKKHILRKGAGAVMRAPTVAAAPSSRQVLKPPSSAPASAAGAQAGQDRHDLERQRREWSEGLKQYIARQRETLKSAPDGKGSDQADALSWQELKLAAEAGFEELLRHQEAAAAAGTASLRCPGMSRAKGGGAVPAAAVAVAAAVVGPAQLRLV
ncbi:hypothetical protein OEZ85_008523 [Tetradesmus obliquus]|uniref:Uncharacterized protein n=1 Tax=Tetradesmus obliquus TaxID=3088 RepID=A0ABY8TLC4_TETOB|nr:hypothetical protein OEZ85_008523 [Tetradesmus obliquus]